MDILKDYEARLEAARRHMNADLRAASEEASPESTGPVKVVAAVPTGSGCGMCAHWKQTTRFNRPPFGMCMWRPDKRPSWFTTEGSTMLFETDGKTCETFTPNNEVRDAAQPRSL